MATKAAGTVKQKVRTPDFSGVPGQLVAMPNFELKFGAKARVSPYDGLLEQLEKAGAAKNQVLCFGDVRARTSVNARAKKLGLKVLCAEHEGKLYVKFAGYAPDSARFKTLARERILEIVETNPRTEMQIAIEARKQGLEDLDAQMVGAILRQIEQQGQVHRRSDGTWHKK